MRLAIAILLLPLCAFASEIICTNAAPCRVWLDWSLTNEMTLTVVADRRRDIEVECVSGGVLAGDDIPLGPHGVRQIFMALKPGTNTFLIERSHRTFYLRRRQ